MKEIIDFVLRMLNIRDSASLSRRWITAEDYFFYFNKMNGTPVPTFNQVREYISQKG